VRVFDSALDAVADVIEGNAELGAVTAPSTLEALARGEIRLLALSSPARLGGAFDAVPTWQQHGVDCVIGAWRGVAGTHGLGPADIRLWEQALRRAVASDVWHAAVARHGWSACYSDGTDLYRILDQERTEMAAALEELGLLRQSEA
jgi:putative tricarboxylic transport membrane protein